MEKDKHLTKRKRKKLAREKMQEEIKSKKTKVNSLRTYMFLVVVVVAVVVGGYKLARWINVSTVEIAPKLVGVTENDWVKGAGEGAEVTIIEYSDFECFACQAYSPIVDRIIKEFPENVRVVYRHFPLQAIHPGSFDAARAAEAAGRQGKFWDMHDELFENLDEWLNEGDPRGKFIEYAVLLGLDEEVFKNDYGSDEIEDKINEHILQANRLGLNSTPTFILNDQKIDHPKGYEDFKSLIEENLTME
jgi:protein-disulfide isomerase